MVGYFFFADVIGKVFITLRLKYILTFAAKKNTTTNNPIYFSAKVTIPLIIILLFPNFTQTHYDLLNSEGSFMFPIPVQLQFLILPGRNTTRPCLWQLSLSTQHFPTYRLLASKVFCNIE